jgi:hypothetical protein
MRRLSTKMGVSLPSPGRKSFLTPSPRVRSSENPNKVRVHCALMRIKALVRFGRSDRTHTQHRPASLWPDG